LNIQKEKKKYLTQKDEELIQIVKEKLDNVINEYGGKAFVKFSTRSPKDAIAAIENVKMKNEFLNLLQRSKSANDDMVAFSSALRNCSFVDNSEEAFDLFKKSDRIKIDLMRLTDYPKAFSIKIIVREFKPMDPSMEFRVFIFKRKITAISQYCYHLYFPHLVKNKNIYKEKIEAFYDQVKDIIPQELCVMDVLILPDDEIKIIELNPFYNDTGACLFSWIEDKDILRNGPLEIRVVDKSPKEPYLDLDHKWRLFVEEYRDKSPFPTQNYRNVVFFVMIVLISYIIYLWINNDPTLKLLKIHH